MKNLMAGLLVMIVSSSAMAATDIVNPSVDGRAFKSKGLMGSNKRLADRICFMITKRKSFHAIDFTIEKKNFIDLSVEFPKTFQESPFNFMTREKFPTIFSDVIVDGYMNARDADLAFVDALVEMGFRPTHKVKYFSKISCE
jgi:hypothetical protein